MTGKIDPKELITMTEAADLLGVHQTTLGRWCDEVDGPAFYQIGTAKKFLPADLDRYVQSRRRGGRLPYFRLQLDDAEVVLGEPRELCHAAGWERDHDYLVHVDQAVAGSHGRLCCGHHIDAVANELLQDLGLALRLSFIDNAGTQEEDPAA